MISFQICLLVLLCTPLLPTEGAKILFLSVFEPRSHRNILMSLATALVKQGHEVTLIGMYEPKDKERVPGVNEITVPIIGKLYQTISMEIFNMTRRSRYEYFAELTEFSKIASETFLDSDIARDLYHHPNAYDAVIVNGLVNEFSYPLAWRAAPITMLLLPSSLLPFTADVMGLPMPFSYIPLSILGYPTLMNFWQRLYSSGLSTLSLVLTRLVAHRNYNARIQQRFPDLPPISEVEEKIALALINAEPGLNSPRPGVPNVVDVGCMHCQPAQALKGELAEFIERVEDEGFILFSLGSVLKASVLPPDLKRIFLKVFAQLKLKVIWKYEEQLEDLPENVRTFKWLPQQDILGHPKIRLFITHSGLLSLQEAVYHGVPVLGFPVFADQPGNIARVLERHMGESLDLHTVTEATMLQSVQKILSDPSYMSAAKKYSSISRDQLQSPTQRAVYWIEYVLRHNGAANLRPQTQHLNLFQYFLLDVLAFVLVSTLISIYAIVKFAQFVLYMCPCITDSY